MLTYPNQTAVSTRDLAWNAAGESLTDTTMTAAQVLERTGQAGWNVRAVPIITDSDGGEMGPDWGLRVPNRFATVATIDGEPRVLGDVGKRHRVFQNEETVDLLDKIVDDSGANFVAGGTLNAFRKTFVVMKLPTGITIGGEDATDLYLGATNTHDGSGALTLWVTAVRLRCTNMLTGAIKGARAKWSIRHSGDLQGKVLLARKALQLSYQWVEAFEREAEELLRSPFIEKQFEMLLDQLAPRSESEHEGWRKRADQKRDTLRYLFHEAETNELGRGTRWGAYNAFTEYADWYLPIKGNDADGSKRATRTLDSPLVENFKQNAWDALVVA